MRIALEYVKDPAAWTDSYLNYVVVLIGLSFSLLFEVTSPRLFVYYISFLYIYIYTLLYDPTIGKNRGEEFDFRFVVDERYDNDIAPDQTEDRNNVWRTCGMEIHPGENRGEECLLSLVRRNIYIRTNDTIEKGNRKRILAIRWKGKASEDFDHVEA